MSLDLKPMLAGKWPGIEKIKFPVIVQAKLDGIRCLVKDGVALSRTFKPIPSKYIQSIIGRPEFEGLDGELIVGDPTDPDCYRNTVSGVMAEDKTPNFTFWVFDKWDSDCRYGDRWEQLSEQWLEWPQQLQLLTIVTAYNADDLDRFETAFVAQGYEGAILRGPDSYYKYGRGTASKMDLLKLKRFTDFEAVIVGVEEEMHNGNEATKDAFGRTARSTVKANKTGKGTLGALICIRADERDGSVAANTFKVGTGFNAAERADFWAMYHKDAKLIVGKIVKVKSFPVGEHERPRHPVFLGLRDPIDMP